MIVSLFALTAAFGGTAHAASDPAQLPPATNPAATSFEGRPEARIAFTRNVRNFRIEREGLDDILYLELPRKRWYRSDISCVGRLYPRDAQGLLPTDSSFGLERSSRITLVGFGHESANCYLNSLVELSEEEAVGLRLIRGRAATPPASPAS